MNALDKKQIRNIFANRLRAVREQKGMSQHNIAQAMDLSQSIISKYEAALTDISLDIVIRYADVFGCSIDYLLGREDTDDSSPKGKMIAVFNRMSRTEQEILADTMCALVLTR